MTFSYITGMSQCGRQRHPERTGSPLREDRVPPAERTGSPPPRRGQGPPHPERTAALLTCRLLLVLWAPHLCTRKSHFEKQSKKLQSSSPVQFCSRISLILGSKKAMSTSIATTCNWNSTRLSRGPPRPQHRGSPAVSPQPCSPLQVQVSQTSGVTEIYQQGRGARLCWGHTSHRHRWYGQGFNCKKDLCGHQWKPRMWN